MAQPRNPEQAELLALLHAAGIRCDLDIDGDVREPGQTHGVVWRPDAPGQGHDVVWSGYLGDATTPRQAAELIAAHVGVPLAPAPTPPPEWAVEILNALRELLARPRTEPLVVAHLAPAAPPAPEPAPFRGDPSTLAWHKALYEALRAEAFNVAWADCPGGSPGGEVRWVESDIPVVERWLAGGHPPRSLGWAVWTGTRNLTPRHTWAVDEVVALCRADRATRAGWRG